MQRLYGDRLRKDGGLTKTLKSVAGKTLGSKAGRHAPEIHRMVSDVRESIEKVEEKVTEVVEGFLEHGEITGLGSRGSRADAVARPMFSEMVSDTKALLQQSREKITITYVITYVNLIGRNS